MVTFNCVECNYSTSINCNYIKHLESKKHKNITEHNIVNKITQFICKNCKKHLCSKQSLDNHVKVCRGTLSTLECSKCNKIFNNRVARYKHEKKCNNSKLVLYNNVPSTITNSNNVTNSNNITNSNNTTINNTIVVNNYGKENIDYLLEHPDFLTFMNKCIEKKTEGICDLIAKKHFDPAHPENHNIRKKNKKDCFLEIYKNNQWNTKNYKEGLDHITIPLETTFSLFMEKIVTENRDIKEGVFKHFMKEVGSILGWDLSAGDYNFSFSNNNMKNDMSDKDKRSLKTKIYRLFCECIYKYTKMVHKI